VDAREQALRRLEAKRNFTRNAVVFAAVTALLVVIWALTNRGGYFWPIWPALGMGIALAINAWTAFGQRSISEADIEREMPRGKGRQP
jgi:hypothetical protein